MGGDNLDQARIAIQNAITHLTEIVVNEDNDGLSDKGIADCEKALPMLLEVWNTIKR